ncbi:MAG TPA: DUF6702 family protein [Chitinophagaceae bacterium]
MASSFYKWLLLPFLIISFGKVPVSLAGNSEPVEIHPYFVSVTEINSNAADKTLEISCKLFTDDFEKTLEKAFKAKVDLVNPPDKSAMDKLINEYLQKHLALKVNDKSVALHYVGFEHEAEAVYCYFIVNQVSGVKKIETTNTILHDFNENQINIMHVTVNGDRKSTKLDYPKSSAVFQF